MTSSPSRIVYTLHGTKTVDRSEPYPHGTPLPGAPIIHPVPSTSRTYSLDDPPPYVAAINRSDSGRRASRLSSSAPYTRPSRTAYPASAPASSTSSVNGSCMPTWQDARRGCIERIQVELNTISIIDTNAMTVVERERDKYKFAAENAQRELRRVAEERDSLREQFEALTLKATPISPSGDDFVQRFSSAGPLRRNSIPRFSRVTSLMNEQSRCKSADPCLTSRGNNDCFDLTIVAPPLPPQRNSSRKCSSPELIRDASRPGEGSRPCVPTSKPDQIDYDHVDILYIPVNGRLFCRACYVNRYLSKDSRGMEVRSFPNNAPWEDLRDHWLIGHPEECQQVAKLKPAAIAELRQRLRAMQSSA